MNDITKVYISPFTNIFQNLCLEDYFLRNCDEEMVLFYSNEACVVMGNFQNPWKETNPTYLSENLVSLARRQSGGGCVYHDEGNLNFCILRNKNILTDGDKTNHLKMIQDVLSTKNIHTEKLPKSGMVFLDDDVLYKFSGEAFKQTKNRSFHHGTLLINSNLDALKNCLVPELQEIKTKAVASNPYKVGNLNSIWKGLTPLQFISEFNLVNKLSPLDYDYTKLHRYVSDHAYDWASKEQVISKTPDFNVVLGNKSYSVRNAQVCQIDAIEVDAIDFSPEKL